MIKKKAFPTLQVDVVKEYYEDITYKCPTRGLITERKKITRYKTRRIDFKPTITGNTIDTIDDVSATCLEEELT